jgi:hypothetical protein
MSQFFLRLNKKGCGWTTSCLFGGGFSEAIRPQKSGFLIHSTEYSNTVVQKQRRECERDVSAFANPSLLLHIGSIAFFLIHLLLQESIRSSEHDDSTLQFGPLCVQQRNAVDNPLYVWQKYTLIRFTFGWNSASPLFKVFPTIIKISRKKGVQSVRLRLNLQRLERA